MLAWWYFTSVFELYLISTRSCETFKYSDSICNDPVKSYVFEITEMRMCRRRRCATVTFTVLCTSLAIVLFSSVTIYEHTLTFNFTINEHGTFYHRSTFQMAKYNLKNSRGEFRVSLRKRGSCNNDTNISNSCSRGPAYHCMTIRGGGRLGNAMFQYASLVGISCYHGYKTALPASHLLRRIFNICSSSKALVRTRTRFKRERGPGKFDTALLKLSHDKNWTLSGYFQSWKYFQNVSDRVRNEFSFKDNIINTMLKEVPILANRSQLVVGVHVRRGDMTSKYERDRGYDVASLGFLKRSMNYFRKHYDNPTFLVCSDNIAWCKRNIRTNDTMFLEGRREIDLASLAHCQHSIVTSGSFGWWGAWLAGGDVVYYKHFPREGTWLDRQYDKADYYPPSWIPMD